MPCWPTATLPIAYVLNSTTRITPGGLHDAARQPWDSPTQCATACAANSTSCTWIPATSARASGQRCCRPSRSGRASSRGAVCGCRWIAATRRPSPLILNTGSGSPSRACSTSGMASRWTTMSWSCPYELRQPRRRQLAHTARPRQDHRGRRFVAAARTPELPGGTGDAALRLPHRPGAAAGRQGTGRESLREPHRHSVCGRPGRRVSRCRACARYRRTVPGATLARHKVPGRVHSSRRRTARAGGRDERGHGPLPAQGIRQTQDRMNTTGTSTQMGTRLKFTKMHGFGYDFVVFDGIGQIVTLTAEQCRRIADRHFGIGCDQILLVEKPTRDDVDFRYRIFNADGGEVEQCGNGARCFARFAPADIPFAAVAEAMTDALKVGQHVFDIAALSMGNPHAVLRVNDLDSAPVDILGAAIESHSRFPQRVTAGFMQVLTPHDIRLRVYERGAGETLACGTGACAAAVAGIRQDWLKSPVSVHTRGGDLIIEWAGKGQPVTMTGPAETVFEGEIEL